MTSPLLTHWFPVQPVLFHASSILEFGVASNELQLQNEPVMCTRDIISAPADARRGVKGVQGTSVSNEDVIKSQENLRKVYA